MSSIIVKLCYNELGCYEVSVLMIRKNRNVWSSIKIYSKKFGYDIQRFSNSPKVTDSPQFR